MKSNIKGTKLTKKELKKIIAGCVGHPRNEDECNNCGGYWDVFICHLPEGSPC